MSGANWTKRVMHCCRASVSGEPHCSNSQLKRVAISATFRPLEERTKKEKSITVESLQPEKKPLVKIFLYLSFYYCFCIYHKNDSRLGSTQCMYSEAGVNYRSCSEGLIAGQ